MTRQILVAVLCIGIPVLLLWPVRERARPYEKIKNPEYLGHGGGVRRA